MKQDIERNVLQALAAANPVPAEDVPALAEPQRERILTSIRARLPEASQAGRRRTRSRKLGLALAVALIAVPALAATGQLVSLLGFSNPGTPVDTRSLSLSEISALKRVGADEGSVKLLGERDGIAFYVARSKAGALCFGIGRASAPAPGFDMLACRGAGSPAFPSTEHPVADFSPVRGQEGGPAIYIWRLVGFAADGVARVGFVDTSGRIHSVAVIGNVYAGADLPHEPATALVALDDAGNEVWREPLSP